MNAVQVRVLWKALTVSEGRDPSLVIRAACIWSAVPSEKKEVVEISGDDLEEYWRCGGL